MAKQEMAPIVELNFQRREHVDDDAMSVSSKYIDGSGSGSEEFLLGKAESKKVKYSRFTMFVVFCPGGYRLWFSYLVLHYRTGKLAAI